MCFDSLRFGKPVDNGTGWKVYLKVGKTLHSPLKTLDGVDTYFSGAFDAVVPVGEPMDAVPAKRGFATYGHSLHCEKTGDSYPYGFHLFLHRADARNYKNTIWGWREWPKGGKLVVRKVDYEQGAHGYHGRVDGRAIIPAVCAKRITVHPAKGGR